MRWLSHLQGKSWKIYWRVKYFFFKKRDRQAMVVSFYLKVGMLM